MKTQNHLNDQNPILFAGIKWQIEEVCCPLCRRNDKLELHTFGPFKIHKCISCECYYLSPRPIESDLLELYKSDMYYEDENIDQGYEDYSMEEKGIHKTNDKRVKLIAGLTSGKKVLDVGAALGFTVAHFHDRGFDAWGCEVSDAAFKRMDDSVKPYIFHGDISSMPPDRFDVITCFDTIEHIYNQKEFISQVCKRLKPRGYFIMTTPIVDYLMNKIQGKRWLSYKVPQHIIYFSRKSVRQLFEEHFDIVNEKMAYYDYSLHFICIRLRRLLPYVGRIIAGIVYLLGMDKLQLKVPTGMSQFIMQKKDASNV